MVCGWLTLNLLTTTIVAPPSNASKWQMGFNSAFKGLMCQVIQVCKGCNAHKICENSLDRRRSWSGSHRGRFCPQRTSTKEILFFPGMCGFLLYFISPCHNCVSSNDWMTGNYCLKGRGRKRWIKVIFLRFLAVTEKILRLRFFENRLLRRIFGPKGDEVTGEWRRLHNEELNDLYSSPNIYKENQLDAV